MRSSRFLPVITFFKTHRIFLAVIGTVSTSLVLAIAIVVNKMALLAADPTSDKHCPPLDPQLSEGSLENAFLETKPVADSLNWRQKGGTFNDVSCLNKTHVYGVVKVTSEKDISDALLFAKQSGVKVSMAGVRHSMGGHAIARNGVILDMLTFNTISLNEETKTVTVQAGATWHDIQKVLHPKYAVKAMQSSDIFSVGGSISVNAHGMDHQAGAVATSIKSLRLMKADGSIVTVSPTQNEELFRHVVGGYGLFGVILDVELEIVDNTIYDFQHQVISYTDFPNFFAKEIEHNDQLGLFYSHLSTAPHNFLKEMLLYKYVTSPDQNLQIPPLAEGTHTKLKRLVLNTSKYSWVAKELKWFAEKTLDPMLAPCTLGRSQAQGEGEACLVARNEPMHDSVPYLQNAIPNDTDILQEYYIPREQFVPFVDELRITLEKHHANLLNASVRIVHQEPVALNYAPVDMFAIVLYLNQTTDEAGNAAMKALTQELIEVTLAKKGTFFLPYQLYYTAEHVQRAYPNATDFFAAKRTYDPTELFSNEFYRRYGQATS